MNQSLPPGATSLTKKGSKLLGRGDREDVLLDAIYIQYTGPRIDQDVRLATDSFEHKFDVLGRVDVTDFIDPDTGQVRIPMDFLIQSVKGFKQWQGKYLTNRKLLQYSMGLRGDKYRVEWRGKTKRSKEKQEGFKRSTIASIINPENK